MSAQPIDPAILDRLTREGRARGRLTIADLAAALPIDAMEPTDVALVVVELEDRGVSVELDDILAGAPPREPPAPPAFDLPERRPDPFSPQPPAAASPAGATAGPEPTPLAPPPSDRPAVAHRAVVLGGLLALLVLGALIALAGYPP